MRPKKLLYIIITAFAAVGLRLQAQVPAYNVTILPSDGSTFIWATGLNNLGEVTGYWSLPNATSYSAFVYANETMTNLPINIGTGNCEAFGINDDTQIVGMCSINETTSHAFLYTLDGGTLDLGGQGSVAEAYCINNLTQIAGRSEENGHQHAVLFHANGTITDLGTLTGPSGTSLAYRMNNNYQADGIGQIVGTSTTPVLPGLSKQIFIYSNGVMSNIGQIVCPNQMSAPTDINNQGQIVGYCLNSNTGMLTAFFYDPANELINHQGEGIAYGINDQEWIVGIQYTEEGVVPYLYIDGKMYNLFDLVPYNPGIDPGAFSPLGINDQGQIAGITSNLGPALLTPIE